MSNEVTSVKTQAIPAVVPSVPRPVQDAKQAEASSRASQTKPAEPAPSAEDVKAVARQLEAYLRSVSRSLEFRVDADSGRTVVTVRDAQTGDMIRQIPSEEVLRLAQMAHDETIVLLSEKV